MSDFSKSVTSADFEQVVIEGSRQTPVVVDFWAPWCSPCRMLTPVLEKLAQDYQGKFILAKVNADENPELSQRYAVRSIPSVMAFLDGEIKNQFLGAQPESAVRQFIDAVLPTEADRLRRQAAQDRSEGALEPALNALRNAAQLEPNNPLVLVDLVEVLLDLGHLAEAQQAGAKLESFGPRDSRTARTLARLQLADDGTRDAIPSVVEARIESNPNDLEARLALAKLYARTQRYEQALELLLAILGRDRTFGDDVARKTMLTVFELLGHDHPLVRRYRKEMAAVIY